jgi:DNA-directed RNA polymerase specialized sigma24 family protein
VLPGSDEEPEEAASEHEVRLLTGKLLSQLPNAWRHAVLLVHVDDVPLRKGAVRLDTDEAIVRRWLEHAFLRARLEELGAAGTTDQSTRRVPDYLVSSAARAQRAKKAASEQAAE